jgi:hypothetical protein
VEQVEKGELTYKQAQAQYGIQRRSKVFTRMRKHGRHPSLQTEEVAQALKMALRGHQTKRQLVHRFGPGHPVLFDLLPVAAPSPPREMLDDRRL